MQLIETFGLPLAGVIALGFYISKKDKEAAKQNDWIQSDLSKDLHTKFNNIHSVVDTDLRMILIKLIDQQKIMQLDLKKIETSQVTMERITVDIIGKLMDKDGGNGFKNKLEKFLKENLRRNYDGMDYNKLGMGFTWILYFRKNSKIIAKQKR